VALLGLGAIFPPASAEFYPLPASAEPSKLPTFVESTNTYLSHKGQRQLALYWPGSRWTTTKKIPQIPLYKQVLFIPLTVCNLRARASLCMGLISFSSASATKNSPQLNLSMADSILSPPTLVQTYIPPLLLEGLVKTAISSALYRFKASNYSIQFQSNQVTFENPPFKTYMRSVFVQGDALAIRVLLRSGKLVVSQQSPSDILCFYTKESRPKFGLFTRLPYSNPRKTIEEITCNDLLKLISNTKCSSYRSPTTGLGMKALPSRTIKFRNLVGAAVVRKV